MFFQNLFARIWKIKEDNLTYFLIIQIFEQEKSLGAFPQLTTLSNQPTKPNQTPSIVT